MIEYAERFIEKNRYLATFGNWMCHNDPESWEKYKTDQKTRQEVYSEYKTDD